MGAQTQVRWHEPEGWVVDGSPDGEASYNIAMHVDPVNAKIPKGRRMDFFKALGDTNLSRLLSNEIFSVGVRRALNNRTKGWVRFREAVGTRSFGWDMPRGDHLIEIFWTSVTAAGADDGTLMIIQDGVVKHDVSNLTGNQRVDKVRLGALSGNTSLANIPAGVMYLDEFESFRTLAP